MKNIFSTIVEQSKEYLTFNYAERRGIMVLVILILLTEGVNAFLPVLITEEKFDNSAYLEDIRLFELALARPDTLNIKTRENKTYTKKQNQKYSSPSKKIRPDPPAVMVEINSADTAQLIKLYGIGPVYAGLIMKYRGLLGGFYSPEQLLEVYGMDSIRYNEIKDHVRSDTAAIKKISVNEAEFKVLLKHPYLDYETVKLICNYRDRIGPISNRDTLRVVIGYDPMFEKVKHYIHY